MGGVQFGSQVKQQGRARHSACEAAGRCGKISKLHLEHVLQVKTLFSHNDPVMRGIQ
jgi:hypothetical protein